MTTDIAVQQKAYWNNAAKDPDVAEKYIANVNTDKCLMAITKDLITGNILEIGCGIGRLTEALQNRKRTRQIHGVDISPEMLALCPQSRVQYGLTDGFKLNYPSKSFANIYSMLVFQHITDLQMRNYIAEAGRILQKNGVFRFQYIEGDSQTPPVDYNHSADKVKAWLAEANIKIARIDTGLIHDSWTWITGVKQ